MAKVHNLVLVNREELYKLRVNSAKLVEENKSLKATIASLEAAAAQVGSAAPGSGGKVMVQGHSHTSGCSSC